jgi:hypothetical protein
MLVLPTCGSCVPRRSIKPEVHYHRLVKIEYDLGDIPRVSKGPLSNLVFDIETLEDKRREIAGNAPLFDQHNVAVFEGQQVCINSEEHYKRGTVAYQISKAMADHFGRRRAFRTVMLDAKQGADYYLTGTLTRFYARQPFSISAKEANVREFALILIELTDLEIHDRNGAIVRKLADSGNRFDEPLSYECYCWPIYWDINKRLKTVVGDLAEQVEKAVTELAAERQAP